MTQAVRRKYHYIYKVTRLDESGRYYIGMHSTDNVDDGYFGSGSLLAKSIKKHGKDKHKKEILEFLPTREALKLREKELVNEELLGDKRCMNLKLGGQGWSSEEVSAMNVSKWQDSEYRKKQSKAIKESMIEKWQDPLFKKKVSDGVKVAISKGMVRGKSKQPMSDETKQKISEGLKSRIKNPDLITIQLAKRDAMLLAKGFKLRTEEQKQRRRDTDSARRDKIKHT